MSTKQHDDDVIKTRRTAAEAQRYRQSVRLSGFGAVELTNAPNLEDTTRPSPEARIEIILENGRKPSISEGVDASFVLELARGLAV